MNELNTYTYQYVYAAKRYFSRKIDAFFHYWYVKLNILDEHQLIREVRQSEKVFELLSQLSAIGCNRLFSEENMK